jgi:hypothetical protein
MTYRDYSYYICRGISLSAGGITENTKVEAIKSITDTIRQLTIDQEVSFTKAIGLKKCILDHFIVALEKLKKKQKFVGSLFNTLNYMFTLQDAFNYKE